MIPRSEPVNLRDLGGIRSGAVAVQRGVAIRADDLSYITDEIADLLVTGGLAAVIDLRSPGEVGLTGRGPLAAHAVAYHHLPLMGDIGASVDSEAPVLTHEVMGEMYVGMVERAAPMLVTALNIIAYTPGATAFHCAAGRDRTGVLAAMLLLALGVSDEEIIADYAKTGPNMPAIQQRTSAVVGPLLLGMGFDYEELMRRTRLDDGPMDVSMRILIDRLRGRYGSALAPLQSAGLSDATIARLRERAIA
ncbi:tyrosine-protein phosphatase [Leucobacter sp. CSA2]|uniref:Tyrosine-protein phosphatase n=1 Tax=Leucobacter edaphi TaxID=2796472 RepID=A0A934QE84_9MICO|nr:tyrosine-protein phosphatase [Leucobacter edaphi]